MLRVNVQPHSYIYFSVYSTQHPDGNREGLLIVSISDVNRHHHKCTSNDKLVLYYVNYILQTWFTYDTCVSAHVLLNNKHFLL